MARWRQQQQRRMQQRNSKLYGSCRLRQLAGVRDEERAVRHFSHSAGARTFLGVYVHDSNAGVQQRRNQVQTDVISENADARIVATGRLQGGLERRVLAPVVVPQKAPTGGPFSRTG